MKPLSRFRKRQKESYSKGCNNTWRKASYVFISWRKNNCINQFCKKSFFLMFRTLKYAFTNIDTWNKFFSYFKILKLLMPVVSWIAKIIRTVKMMCNFKELGAWILCYGPMVVSQFIISYDPCMQLSQLPVGQGTACPFIFKLQRERIWKFYIVVIDIVVAVILLMLIIILFVLFFGWWWWWCWCWCCCWYCYCRCCCCLVVVLLLLMLIFFIVVVFDGVFRFVIRSN